MDKCACFRLLEILFSIFIFFLKSIMIIISSALLALYVRLQYTRVCAQYVYCLFCWIIEIVQWISLALSAIESMWLRNVHNVQSHYSSGAFSWHCLHFFLAQLFRILIIGLWSQFSSKKIFSLHDSILIHLVRHKTFMLPLLMGWFPVSMYISI